MPTPARASLLALALMIPAARADEPARAGALVIVGGGGMPDSVRDKFMALAGGKAARLVVIPTAGEAADRKAEEEGYLQPWRKYQPASLVLLHTRSREKADDPGFARPIAEATAVWFSGGDQVKLAAPYRGTAVEREMKALLKRGGVIGGTSAGAAVMSDVMIEGGYPKADVGRGFGFVTNAVVDQHFLRRSRVNRLLGVLAERPNLIGLGIDEGTALVVEGDRWSVLGRSYVLACEVGPDGKPARFESFGDGDRGTFRPSGLPARERARAQD
ncbi:MAG TPA: cyanophycinase [Isosphaeraceae bacterium]